MTITWYHPLWIVREPCEDVPAVAAFNQDPRAWMIMSLEVADVFRMKLFRWWITATIHLIILDQTLL